MNPKILLLTFALTFTFLADIPTIAQNAQRERNVADEDGDTTTARFPTWEAKLSGGSYSVDLNSVTSVSSHQYILNIGGSPTARVVEVIAASQGPLVARFYYLEPLNAQSPVGIGQSSLDLLQEKLQQGAERVGADAILTQVIKDYPLTTHAHTVEYRVGDEDTIDQLYRSLDRAWKRKRSSKFSPSSEKE